MVSYHSFEFSYEFIISLIFISALITIIVSDIEYMIILDEIIAVSCILIIILELQRVLIVHMMKRDIFQMEWHMQE